MLDSSQHRPPRRGRPRAVTTLTILPEHLRHLFTPSQHLVLAGLVDSMLDCWRVVRSRRELMKTTGLGRTIVEDALRKARLIGLTREWTHLPYEDANTIEIVSAEWREWIEAGRERQRLNRWQ